MASDGTIEAGRVAKEPLFAEVALDHFLDTCQTIGWLSGEERALLIRYKLDGATCREMAAENGRGPPAIEHRVHQLIDRLRRLARQSRWQRAPEQLELFPEGISVVARGTREKIFQGNIAYPRNGGTEVLAIDNKSLWDRELKPGIISYFDAGVVPQITSLNECPSVEVTVRLQNGREFKAQGRASYSPAFADWRTRCANE